MDWLKRAWHKFWSNPYKWGLWKWIGGRPWTFIRRDFYHIAPLLNIGFFFWGGVACGVYLEGIRAWTAVSLWHFIGFVLIVWLIGGLQCHFFWGTKYQPGQEGS